MFAVVETGGKQIKAVPGHSIDIEKLLENKGDKVSLKNVLMIVQGKDSKIGNPYIKGASVNGHIIETSKNDKVIVYKMRPKKGTRKKQGHRQWYSKIFIENIELDGKVIATAEERKKQSAVSKQSEEKQEEEIKPKKVKAKKKED